MPIRVARGKQVVERVRHWTRGPLLYHGGSGAVFQGFDNDSHDKQKIAVKSVPMQDIKGLRSVMHERKMLERLSKCPQIVQFLGTSISDHVKEFEEKRTMNLVLEYMPKGDLSRLLLSCEGKKLSEAVCKAYTRDLIHAISFMHADGVVLGNINGSNVLVGHRNVKLCDFGLSWDSKLKPPQWIQDCYMHFEHQQKVPESFMDTTTWGPPMDIFSLGCLVCEMLIGRRARLHDLSSPGYERNKAQGHISSSNLTVEIPKNGWEDKPHAHDFVTKCLIKTPKLRWTADQLRKHPWIEDVDDLMIVFNMNRWHTLKFWSKNRKTQFLNWQMNHGPGIRHPGPGTRHI